MTSSFREVIEREKFWVTTAFGAFSFWAGGMMSLDSMGPPSVMPRRLHESFAALAPEDAHESYSREREEARRNGIAWRPARPRN